MRVLLIVAHPNKKSFNHAIAAAVQKTLLRNGHEVIYHDLYEEGFDPVIKKEELSREAPTDPVIKKHCHELSKAEGIVVVHPNWWGQPPAVLKGWIDRVFRPGVAYRFADKGEGVPKGLLKARTAVVLNTSDTHETRERLVFGDPLELIWKQCVFDLCGVKGFFRKTFRVVVTSSLRQRRRWLTEARQIVDDLFPPLP